VRRRARATVFLLALLLSGCSAFEAVDYYWQGTAGEFDILARAKPVDEVIAQGEDAALSIRLARAREIRAFASSELGLPDNRSYTRYSDVGRPFVVWNVYATPALSLKPRQWCFPIAGCVNYRGYFREAEARAEAERFRALGDDVYVSGVPAYSTLGYFDDPLLSTFVRWPETEVARLVFHELAHQVLYVKDDSVFNESFAVTVEEAGVTRWLAAQNSPKLDAEFARAQRYRMIFRDLVNSTRTRLAAIYAGEASDEAKRAAKAEALEAMGAAYTAAKTADPGFAGYDRWFRGYANEGPNNASLASVALYTAQVPAFEALLAQEGGDLPRFYLRVKTIAALDKPDRQRALAQAAPAAVTLSH
jgi:predicted aminopeptidase